MKRLPALLLLAAATPLFIASTQAELAFPEELRPEEAEVVRAIAGRSGIEVEVGKLPGFAVDGAKKALGELGVEVGELQSFSILDPKARQRALGFLYTPEGRIVAIRGNGPWLPNDSLRDLVALEELAFLSVDHNGHAGPQEEENPFNGAGLDALGDSNLKAVQLGLSFNDRGMEQAAKIKGLKEFRVGHSRASGAGIDFFAGHPNLQAFSIAEMASDRVKPADLARIAKIPNLQEVGFKECYVTYDDGFVHLAPLKGQLETIDLRMSLFSEEDLERLKADHPTAEILTSTPEEIAKGHIFIARALARQAPPELAEPLQQAIDALPKKKK